MSTTPKPRCSETVVEYQGLARFTHQCTKPAFEDGMCKTHLRAKRPPANADLVRVPTAEPRVSSSFEIVLRWETEHAPVFKPRHGETLAWERMTFDFRGDGSSTPTWSGYGYKIKDNGEPGKAKADSRFNKWEEIPAEVQPFISDALVGAKASLKGSL
jgi:hypothetical protein